MKPSGATTFGPALFIAALSAALATFAISSGHFGGASETAQLKSELVELRDQVTELQQLRSSVQNLEKDLDSVRSVVAPKLQEQPIFPATFRPNRAHLDDPFLGDKNAKILLMGFSDYSCKPCREFSLNTLTQIQKDYLDTKRIKFILRDFPLESRPRSTAAAVLAQCAGEQGKYWQAHDVLLRRELEKDDEMLSAVTKELPVDATKLSRCIKSKRYLKEVSEDIEEAKKLGAKGAPGFFVGTLQKDGSYRGVFIRGAQPFPVFQHEIDSQLVALAASSLVAPAESSEPKS